MDSFFTSLGLNTFTTFIVVMYILVVVMLVALLSYKSKIKQTKKNEAYELIIKGITQKTFESDNDISLIYKKIISPYFDNISYADFLESFLIYIRRKDDKGSQIVEMTNRIRPIIERERAEKPYTNIHDRERRILLAIEMSAQKGEYNSIKNNLEDLSIVIKNNQDGLRKAEIINRWTIPCSIVSILLTLFIWLYGSSLSDKEVQRISTQIYTSISDSLKTAKSDSLSIIK